MVIPSPDNGAPWVFRRRIRLIRRDGASSGAVEDDFHAFMVLMSHDGERVREVRARALRFPRTTCCEAIEPLRLLEGMPLSADSRAVGRVTDARLQCTHLFDLAGLTMAHALRTVPRREYDVGIPQPLDDRMDISVRVDGELRLSLQVRSNIIECPAPFNGRNIGTGFSAWLYETVPDAELRELALVAQRAWFVCRGRCQRESTGDPQGRWFSVARGACYSFQPQQHERAQQVESHFRDFTRSEADLLSFFDAWGSK